MSNMLSPAADNLMVQDEPALQRMHTSPGQRLLSASFISTLCRLNDLDVHENLDLSQYSRWRIGGFADCVVCPHNNDALARVISLVQQEQIPFAVIGLTTNLLFAGQGIRALVIHIGHHFGDLDIHGRRVRSQAGYWVPGFARKVARAGLSGSEHLAGIPGTLGGLICMNGGSQRRGIGENLVRVMTIDSQGKEHCHSRENCGFAYRTSVFQSNGHIITGAEFEFDIAADKTAVLRTMKRILESRRRKFPQKLPNCGSVFVSNPAMYERYGPPGAVIEKCGLKGTVRGGAMISPLHANFIVNNGNASADDVLYLIDLARARVYRETGYDLVAEAKYVDILGRFSPAHIVARRRFQTLSR